jgi:hypothetical protein
VARAAIRMASPKRVDTIEELTGLLARAYCIERCMELAVQWASYVRASPGQRETVLGLARDSMQHGAALQRLGMRLGGLDLEAMSAGLGRADVDLRGRPDRELMDEIRAHDLIAHGIYKRLLAYTDRDLVRRAWRGWSSSSRGRSRGVGRDLWPRRPRHRMRRNPLFLSIRRAPTRTRRGRTVPRGRRRSMVKHGGCPHA